MKLIRKAVSLFTLTYELRSALKRFLPRLQALVAECSVPGTNSHAVRYTVILGNCAEFPNLFFNTQHGFILCVLQGEKKIPIAGIEFARRGLRTLEVHGLCAVEGAHEYRVPLLWGKLLYRILIEILGELKHTTLFDCIAVRSPYQILNMLVMREDFCGRHITSRIFRENLEILKLMLSSLPEKVGFTVCRGRLLFFL